MTLSVNGEPMQDGNTSQMIFSIAEQIAYLSRILTLQPGDLIATARPMAWAWAVACISSLAIR